MISVVGQEFWGPYVEEWAVPPVERAKRNAEKQSFFARLGTPIVRMIVLKGESVLHRREDNNLYRSCSTLDAVELHPIPEPRRELRTSEPDDGPHPAQAREFSL